MLGKRSNNLITYKTANFFIDLIVPMQLLLIKFESYFAFYGWIE
jgi:hypothetical protein